MAASSGVERGAAALCDSNEPGGGVTPFSRHQAPGSRWVRRALPSLVGSWSGIGGSGGISWPSASSCASSSASFSSAMPIGPCSWALRNWRTTGSSLDSSISRGPNIAR